MNERKEIIDEACRKMLYHSMSPEPTAPRCVELKLNEAFAVADRIRELEKRPTVESVRELVEAIDDMEIFIPEESREHRFWSNLKEKQLALQQQIEVKE